MLLVRAAHIDDADDLAAAHVEGWRVGYRGLFPDEYLDSHEFASERLERWRAWTWNALGRSTLYVAELDRRVVGFAHIGPEREQPECDQSGRPAVPALAAAVRGEVYGFYLHPDAWGSGCAAALMDHATSQLIEDGYDSAVLWVLRDNPRARRFYERAGWAATGRSLLWPGPQTAAPPPEPVNEVEYATVLAR
jgi:ribosomal protein S18 acetylase RimI-like enzyme